jgi:phage terminase large subunit GpA-like protein
MPSKGDSLPSSERAIFNISKNVPGTTCRLILLNTDKLKQEAYGALRIGTPDGDPPKSGLPGYCHFPKDYDKGYYDGLTSESRHAKPTPRGGQRLVWQEHGRNEPLDCRQYALAGLYVFHDLLSEQFREEYDLYIEASDGTKQPRKLTWNEFWTLLERSHQ